ncbi:hypothetical protein [Rhizobium sp. BK176]|uniref:hypothetical protein n=1 Tax=Rhizobium sp. BK176 TaxID=2587071 RepID=UPI002169D056|nr:hypothetical protein [Rhizobium sp. BK176]MCS4089562.1 HD superfamily phosphodiesterase [Rhizobium sp. BK176]
MEIEDENPLHDIHSEIAYGDLEEIDLEPYFGAPDEEIENHIRSLASRASIGQLRQALSIPLDGEDREREVLIEMFVERRMAVVSKIRLAIQSI